MAYEVKKVACFYGIYEHKELKLLCNLKGNAHKIKEVLELDAEKIDAKREGAKKQ